MKNIFFNTPVKGKVIIAFVTACVALALAWNISKYTFTEMLHTVQDLSAPNDKLTVVSHLSGRITRIDQLQRTMAIDSENYQGTFIKEFKTLGLTLDTLDRLYKDNPIQIKRINFMRQLLSERNKLFFNYLHTREKLVNNDKLSDQVESLNGILSNNINKNDSTTVHTTQKKVSTTTVLPVEKEFQKGFFNRLFGKKKNQEKVINEELNITVDTITLASQDTALKTVKKAMLSMEQEQLRQSEKFISQETRLALASNSLTNQMLNILQQVEEDVMKQSASNNLQAREVVGSSVRYINIILITFLSLTAILLYFILTDISRSNAYRKQLEAAKDEAEYHSRAKQRFLANMSHEIRTPLQAIIGFTELLKNGKKSEYTIDAIHHSSTHLLQIVNEVLDYSRIISGKLTFNVSVFNLTDLLEEVVSVMHLSAQEKSLDLRTDFDLSPSEYISGDAFRLKQILYNLLSNAIKFTNSGEITLRTSSKHHNGSAYLRFSVEDTGIGIADDDLVRVFNEFDQGSGSENGQIRSGSGLGLSIVKAVTESLGGRIYVKSKKGEGTCFTLYLGFELAEKQVNAGPDKTSGKPMVQGKVWVVDDDAFILQLCSSILENNKVAHICFDAPDKILNAGWDDKVSCILLDIRMPGMNGAELCAILRNRVPAHVKIYAITAQALPEERAWIMSQGFDGQLMKPFRETELLNLILSENFVETERTWHMDSLLKMTFGDEQQLKKIIDLFIRDSENDIHLLRAAAKNHDTDQLSLIFHRIAGRTAQMGAKELSLAFRKLEMDSQKGLLEEEEMNYQLNKLADLVKFIKEEVNAGTFSQQV